MAKRIKPKNKPHRRLNRTPSTKKTVKCRHCGEQRNLLEMCCFKSIFG